MSFVLQASLQIVIKTYILLIRGVATIEATEAAASPKNYY